MAGNVFVTSRPLWYRVFMRFRRGNQRLAQIFVGWFFGAILAAYEQTGFLTGKISYNTAPTAIKVAFWIAGAGFVLALLFSPGKFRSWRYPFGYTAMNAWTDWAAVVISVLVACAVTVVIGAVLS